MSRIELADHFTTCSEMLSEKEKLKIHEYDPLIDFVSMYPNYMRSYSIHAESLEFQDLTIAQYVGSGGIFPDQLHSTGITHAPTTFMEVLRDTWSESMVGTIISLFASMVGTIISPFAGIHDIDSNAADHVSRSTSNIVARRTPDHVARGSSDNVWIPNYGNVLIRNDPPVLVNSSEQLMRWRRPRRHILNNQIVQVPRTRRFETQMSLQVPLEFFFNRSTDSALPWVFTRGQYINTDDTDVDD